jgi:hypothetical protein
MLVLWVYLSALPLLFLLLLLLLLLIIPALLPVCFSILVLLGNTTVETMYVFNLSSIPPRDGKGFKGFLPQLDEFYFTTAEKKIFENCRCIVPNFMND